MGLLAQPQCWASPLPVPRASAPCRRSLEELLRPELREGKYAALNLRRVGLILDKYRELDRHSSYSAMHRSKQAEVGGQAAWGGGRAGRGSLGAGGCWVCPPASGRGFCVGRDSDSTSIAAATHTSPLSGAKEGQ